MKQNFKVGDKVNLVQTMSFVGRPPAIVRETFITRTSKIYCWAKGLKWADSSGKFNPDDKFHVDGRSIGGGNYSLQAIAS